MVATKLNQSTARPAPVNPMPQLYKRLTAAGFDKNFVRKFVLPDWWADKLAVNPSTMAMAEVSLARMLGFSIAALRDNESPLQIALPANTRLKRLRGTPPDSLKPAIALAQSAAKQIVPSLADVPAFRTVDDAVAIRRDILSRHPTVTLNALVEFSWSHGVVVLHLKNFPSGSAKFMGLAFYCGESPVIVLGYGSDSPPWLAFHLAHELGHVMLGHVAPGGALFLDGEEGRMSSAADADPEEADADAFGMCLLTGAPPLKLGSTPGMNAGALAHHAKYQEDSSHIDAGTYVLCHGRTFDRMAAAQGALGQLGLNHGAYKIINDALGAHLAEELSESATAAMALLEAVPA